MDVRILLIACLCLVARVHGAAFGEDCTQDTDCSSTDPNTKCGTTAPKKCVCKDIYIRQGDACKVKRTQACSAATDCVANAECANSVCTCKTAGAKANGDVCDQVYDMACTDNADCTTNLQNSECSSQKCKCKANYKTTGTLPVCTKVIGSSCTTATAAAECTNHVTNSECTGTAQSMTCSCKNGYYGDGCGVVYNMKTCANDNECSELKHSKCDAQKCKCADKAVKEGMICNIKADQNCVANDLCTLHSTCTGGKCKCGDGYKTDANNEKCESENTGTTLKVSVLLMVAALVTVFLR